MRTARPDGEHPGDQSDHLLGASDELLPGDAYDGVSADIQRSIACPISFERLFARMKGEPIDLYHHTLLTPHEVNLEAVELGIGLWLGQSRRAHEGVQLTLGF